MTGFCSRCHTRSDCLSAGTMLRLCPLCTMTPNCGEYRHTFVGGDSAGTWICLVCGAALGSQPLKTEVVAEPTPAPADFYC